MRRWVGPVAASCLALGCGSAAVDAKDEGGLALTPVDGGTSVDGGTPVVDAAPPVGFITRVVSFKPGQCAGYVGAGGMPRVVYGPPVGGGRSMGSTDVVSLGIGGEIIVAFTPDIIVDGPGDDFIVFENAFDGPDGVYAEPGEVSVSDDLEHWSTYPCTQTTESPPYGQCAGVNPVFSNPGNGISPFDVDAAGGDDFDLRQLGVTTAKYVRIRDVIVEPCDAGDAAPIKDGFDLDAISVVNGSVDAQ